MLDLAQEFDAERRGAFRRALILSCVAHAALLTLLYFSPSPSANAPALPGVVTVDLLAAAPAMAPVAPPAEPPPATPAPVPVEPPKPPPPPPPQKVVLPKEPAPLPETPPPKPKPKPVPKDYDTLMRELRAQSGDARPAPVETPQPARVAVAGPAGGTVRVSPEVAAWIRDVKIRVHRNWVKLPGFEGLVTSLLVTIDADGNVVGDPKIKQRSGNPYYDDSVVRAIQKASPLPKPPTPGEWTFVFPSEEPS